MRIAFVVLLFGLGVVVVSGNIAHAERAAPAASSSRVKSVRAARNTASAPRSKAGDPARVTAQNLYTLKPKGRTLLLRDPDGRTVARLPAVLRAGYNGRPLRLSAQWKRESDTVYIARARHNDAHVAFRLEAQPDRPLMVLDVDVTYQRPIKVGYETWTLSPKGVAGTMLDRRYAHVPLKKRALFVDRWTPHRAQWVSRTKGAEPAFALIADSGVEAIRASKQKVIFEFDHKSNHEHSVHDACYDEYDRDREYRSVSETKHAASTTTHHRIVFAVGKADVPVKARWPDGRRAAISIIDHADNGNRHTLRALMYGSSRKGPKSKNIGGLVGNGVAITKTVFATPGQLGDDRFRALADALSAAGSEIAPHSLTPGTDSRARIETGMQDVFHNYAPRSWVDHQPDTNCESVNNRGGLSGHRYNVMGTLRKAGLRYAWEAPDFLGWRGLNFFRPQKPSERVRFFYPAQAVSADSSDMWLFRSAWLFLPHKKVTARLRSRALDKLEADQGLFVAHTYFGATKSIDDDDGRSLFEKDRRGALVIRRDYERAFRRLGMRHKDGSLWVTSMRDLGDWMQHWASAQVRVVDATHIELTQPDDATPGVLTLTAASDGVFIDDARVPASSGPTLIEMAAPVYDASLRVVFDDDQERVARR